MSDLNSIILEGIIDKKPEYILKDKGDPIMVLSLVSSRDEIDVNGETYKAKFAIKVHVSGRLAEKCSELARDGVRARVVGRIIWYVSLSEGDGGIRIRSEHIEFVPVK